MIGRKPEGYKELLVYQKAAELQAATLALTNLFPRDKTGIGLKDQMDRSARSGTKNIIEGWKRNSTGEYFHFLGYAIGSVEALKDDCADITKGLYREINGIMGVMGTRGENGSNGTPILPIYPFTPFELDQLRFYPLDPALPPIVQLYLKCKEVLMLLHKLQQSLDHKMDEEMTKSASTRARERIQDFKKGNAVIIDHMAKLGYIRLENGQFVKREEGEKKE